MSTTDFNDLQPLPHVAKGRYQHYKGGLYEVLDVAYHSEDLSPVVVYRNLSHGTLWVRPAHMFDETVTVDGQTVLRFRKIEEASAA